jgi:hypothetical protein
MLYLPIPVVAADADAVLFCEVRTVDRFDTDSLTMMSSSPLQLQFER